MNVFSCLVLLAAAPDASPLFRIHTKLPGLDYVNVSGAKDQIPILEQNGQGIALLDFDNDGWLDLFVTKYLSKIYSVKWR